MMEGTLIPMRQLALSSFGLGLGSRLQADRDAC